MASLLNWMGVDVDWVNNLIVESSTANTGIIASNTEVLDYRRPCMGHGVWLRIAGCRVVTPPDEDEYVVYTLEYKIGQAASELKQSKEISGDVAEQEARTRRDYRYSELAHFHDSLTEEFVGLPLFPARTLFASVSQTFLETRMKGLAAYFRALVQRVDVMKACALAPLLHVKHTVLRAELTRTPHHVTTERKSVDSTSMTTATHPTNTNLTAHASATEHARPHVFDLTFVEESNSILLVKKLSFAEKFNVMKIIEISRDTFAVAVGDHSPLAQVDSFLEIVFGDDAKHKRALGESTLNEGDEEEIVNYGAVYIFKMDARNVFRRVSHYFFESACQYMTYDPNKQFLFIANTDGILHILSVHDDGEKLEIIDSLPLYNEPFTCLEFQATSYSDSKTVIDQSKTGAFILTCSEEGTIKAVNVNSGAVVFEYRYEEARVSALAYDPIHARLFVGCYDRYIYVFSTKQCFESLFGSKAPVESSAYVVPEYLEKLPTAQSKRLKRTPKLLTRLPGHEGSVRGLIYHPGLRMLYSCSFDGSVLGWLVPRPGHEAAMSVTTSFLADQNTIECMTLSADGNVLITGNSQGNALVWRVRDACVLFGIDCAEKSIKSVAITETGRLLTGGEDDCLSMWKFDFMSQTLAE